MRVQSLAWVFLAACAGGAPDTVDDVGTGEATAVAARMLGARTDLVLASRHRSLAGEHLRYRQLAADGTPVVDREVSVHLDGTSGKWSRSRIVGELVGGLQLVGERRITVPIAEERARAAIVEGRVERVVVEPVALPSDRLDVVRAGYRAIVETREPAHGWEVWIDGDGRAEVIRDTYKFADGTGHVFDPNPLAQTGDTALADNNDQTSPALDAARFQVTLPRLDGSGFLRGTFADVKQNGQRASSPQLAFSYTRDDDRFEEVNVYYHLDAAQAKLQALGFMDANNRVQVATVNAGNQDNSFYSPSSKEISFGAGGVDDAEDGDIVVHEYGHAVQDNIVPGFGASPEAGAMGEGFGDILAATLGPADPAHTQAVSRACVGAWDAISYSNTSPPCLRRTDGGKHWPEDSTGEVHDDGEIWSAAVWALYTALGDPALGLKLTVESFYNVSPNTSFAAWSEALIAADVSLNAGVNVDTIKKALWDRGLYRVPAVPGAFEGAPATMPVDLAPASPLADDADDKLVIEHPGAGAIRVHFSRFAMESDAGCLDMRCDSVYIFDGAGTLYGILGGDLGATDGPIVPGDTVVIRWVTDGSVPSAGFHVDRYDHGTGGSISDGSGPLDAGPSGPDAGIDRPDEMMESGGCCDSGRGDASMALGALAFALVTLRRQRRRATRKQRA